MPAAKRALAAACAILVGCSLTPADAGYEPPTQRPTVQPGSLIFVPDDKGRCTLGFLVRDPEGVTYGVTWGSCPADQPSPATVGVNTAFYGARTWKPGKGPVVQGYNPKIKAVGRFVLQVSEPDNDSLQYSIIRLDRGVTYDSTVALTGGPAPKPYTASTLTPQSVTSVTHDGYATDVEGGPQGYHNGQRTEVAYLGLEPTSFRVTAAATLSEGGAPVLLLPGDGPAIAVGIRSGRFGTGATVGNEDGRAAGSVIYRLDAILQDASELLGRRLNLLSAGKRGKTTR